MHEVNGKGKHELFPGTNWKDGKLGVERLCRRNEASGSGLLRVRTQKLSRRWVGRFACGWAEEPPLLSRVKQGAGVAVLSTWTTTTQRDGALDRISELPPLVGGSDSEERGRDLESEMARPSWLLPRQRKIVRRDWRNPLCAANQGPKMDVFACRARASQGLADRCQLPSEKNTSTLGCGRQLAEWKQAGI